MTAGVRQARLIAVLFTFFAVGSIGLAVAMIHGVQQDRRRPPTGGGARLIGSAVRSAANGAGATGERDPGRSATPSGSASSRHGGPIQSSPVPGTSAQQPSTGVRPSLSAPATGAFTATYQTISTRSGSFRGKLTVVNQGSSAGRWEVDLDFPTGVTVTWSSGGSYRQRGTVASFTWDDALDAGGTLSVEFEANKTAQDLAEFVPRSCSINGSACR